MLKYSTRRSPQQLLVAVREPAASGHIEAALSVPLKSELDPTHVLPLTYFSHTSPPEVMGPELSLL